MARSLVDVMSDVSVDSDDEPHVMDPSDPRAHGREELTAKRGSELSPAGPGGSRWDSDQDDDEEDEVDEDLGVRIDSDDDDGQDGATDSSAIVAAKLKARLSSWAAARFLVPRSERKLPVIEEPPIEPLNDFILSDFGTRFRGGAGSMDTVDEDAESSGDEGDNKLQVGAPLFTSEPLPMSKDEDKGADGKTTTKDKGDAARKPRRENRYFITDLATKCFNCGQVGHMASVCANDKVQRPCYYCALRGHPSFACPHLPCSACLQLGHEFKDCPNRRVVRSQNCSLCGRSGHKADACDNTSSSSQLTCMVCLEVGHLSCTPFPPPADRRTYCAYCAGNHTLSRCEDYVEPAATSFSARLPRNDMKCFVCNTAGHIAAECPRRTGYNGGNSCFNCGERGHYASDCPRASTRGGGGGGGGAKTSGRKRGRNEYYADDYDEDEDYGYGNGNGKHRGKRTGSNHRSVEYDDGSDDDQYYYVPGGGNSGRHSHKKPRVDAALPSYRNGGGSGGGGYHKGGNSRGNDRRRWN